MKHFFVYMYEWDDGYVYVGRSRQGVNRFGNPECYKNNKELYIALTTKPYKASIVFESDDIWDVGWYEHFLIQLYPKRYNINSEIDWKRHIKGYIKQYKKKFEDMGWVVEDKYDTYQSPSSLI